MTLVTASIPGGIHMDVQENINIANHVAKRQNLLPYIVKARAEQEPDRLLMEEVETGQCLSYSEFHQSALRWAGALDALGVSRDDTVATMFPASVAAYQVWFGISWLRAIEVPLNNEYLGPMLATLLNRSMARILVIAEEFVDRIADIAEQCTCLEIVIVPDAQQRPILPIRTLIKEDLFLEDIKDWEGPAHYDPLGIAFTSGTTGPSKGVVVPWAQLAGVINSNFPGDKAEDYTDGGYYCPWPPYNLLGKGALDIAVRQGLRFIVRRRFSMRNFWPDVRKYNCTHAAIPFVATWLWQEPESSDDATNPLRRVLMVPVIKEFEAFAKRFNVRVSTGYASTEAGYCFGMADQLIPGSCGKVTQGFEVRVVDEFDEVVAPGELGQLIVRNKEPWQQMTKYFNDPVATSAVWRNGWYHTGDAFRYDVDGNFYFSGRMKDYIKRRGQNISLSDLEGQVDAHPDVIECAVVGIATSLAGEGGFADEDIKLFVVKTPHSTLTETELYEFLRQRTPRFMHPQYIEFIDSLPRGELNKILKRELRARPAGGALVQRSD